jgi:ketosteroid isomerase-like protein
MIKGLLIGLAALPLAVGCSSDDGGSSDAVDQAHEVQDAYVEAYEAGDVDAMIELYADDATWVNQTYLDNRTGIASMTNLLEWVVDTTDFGQSEIVERFVSDDGTQGVIVYHWVGNRTDNGDAFDLDMTHVQEYEDGMITSVTASFANSDAYDQLMG